MLILKNLSVSYDGKKILEDINANFNEGEINAILGANGSGKTTLCYAIAGHPSYVVSGDIILDGEKINNLLAEERALKGIFLAFQNPVSIEGLKVKKIISTIAEKRNTSYEEIENAKSKLGVENNLLERSLNVNFSGGEKKKIELLQAIIFKPRVLLLDEIDAGIDIDNLKKLKEIVKELKRKKTIIVIVTHNLWILEQIKPSKIYVLKDGKIAKYGGKELIEEIKREGYKSI